MATGAPADGGDMATGEWQVVTRRRRSPKVAKAPAQADLNGVRPYGTYPTRATYAQMAAAPPKSNGSHHGSEGSTKSTSPPSTRPTSPISPPPARFFISPHSPTTKLRFPPHLTFQEWRKRCFNCCKLGHSAATCHQQKRCGKCWLQGHIASQCKEQVLNPAAQPFYPVTKPEARSKPPSEPVVVARL